MSKIVIKAENVSKQYRLGSIGTKTLANDFKRWMYQLRGKEDPFLKIGEANDRSKKGSSEYVWALKDINFEVEQGEVIGIIGKNGAGKSTLLKILSRVTSPTTGQIKINGRMASLLEVGTGFHPELTGKENVFLNGAIMGMSKSEIKSKFDEIIDFSGVERYIDTPVKRYSSGMYVRLAFAVAAHLEPEILIVDEVLAVGDAEFQKKCLGKMKDVSGQGRTVLFVSHNMGAIQSLCNKSIYLKHGTIQQSGPTDKIIQHYLSNELKSEEEQEIPFDSNLPACVTKVTLLNSENQKTKTYLSGEELKFSFTVETAIKGNYQLGIGIASALDVNIYSEISDTFELKEGSNEIIYENVQVKLAPGNYALTFNFMFNGKSIQYCEKFINFETLEINKTGETYSLNKGAGFLITQGIFTIN
ncbi:MAG TPA: polysaccharide ABC transporter ATP-binding protein [Bacteroidia bacterium]